MSSAEMARKAAKPAGFFTITCCRNMPPTDTPLHKSADATATLSNSVSAIKVESALHHLPPRNGLRQRKKIHDACGDGGQRELEQPEGEQTGRVDGRRVGEAGDEQEGRLPSTSEGVAFNVQKGGAGQAT